MDKFGFSPAQWAAAKTEAKESMVARAKMRDTIPYSELVSKIRAIHLDAHDRRLNHLLGEISTDEDAAGRAMLSVVVVHKTGDMQPGPGFFELAEELGRDTSNILQCWIKELNLVFEYWGGPSATGRENAARRNQSSQS